MHGKIISSRGGAAFDLLFEPLSRFVVLKPIKDIFTFDLAVLSKPSRDLLNLFGSWGPYAIIVVKFLQYSYLVSCGSPAWACWPAVTVVPFAAAATSPVSLVLVLLLLRLHMILYMMQSKQGDANKEKAKRQKYKREKVKERMVSESECECA